MVAEPAASNSATRPAPESRVARGQQPVSGIRMRRGKGLDTRSGRGIVNYIAHEYAENTAWPGVRTDRRLFDDEELRCLPCRSRLSDDVPRETGESQAPGARLIALVGQCTGQAARESLPGVTGLHAEQGHVQAKEPETGVLADGELQVPIVDIVARLQIAIEDGGAGP